LVVIPERVLRELEAHAREALPGEACGVVVLRDGVAERYERGRNRSTSDFRYELEVDPEVWFLEDEGYELAIFHSHPETAPRPSRTDIENIGLWEGKPYLIMTGTNGELAGWKIASGEATAMPVTTGRPTIGQPSGVQQS
jgi:[CysO sulfur-carrier protein]-S-L-cysteine hydrolase